MIEGLLQPLHLVVILAIALIVLGPKRLPEAGKGIGEAIRGFRQSVSGEEDRERIERPATRTEERAPEA